MDILSDFFDPIPLTAMIAAVFLLVLFMVIARIFKMPEIFFRRQKARGDIRYLMFTDKLAKEAEAAANAEAEAQKAEPPAETPPAEDAGKAP